MASKKDFRGSRRAVAQGLTEGSATASELARRLDRPTGSFFGVLTRMVTEGLIEADTETPTRGSRYTLTREAHDVLLEMEDRPVEPGVLRGGERLLEISGGAQRAAVQNILAGEQGTEGLVWAADLNGSWLLAIEAPDSYPLERLGMMLERAGAEIRQVGIVGSIFAADDLRIRADWMIQEVERGA